MLVALLSGEALEHRVWAGAAGTRRAVDLTTFEGERCGVEGDGEPQQCPTAEAGVRALLEVRKKPGIDPSSFRQLLSAEADLGPAMGDAAGQIAHPDHSRLRRHLGASEACSCGRGARAPMSGSRWCHGRSLSLMHARSIGT
jgi:hypothetical protein